ncbi:hypothetical protein ACFRJ9_21600 [Paenarthrobacter sp. NPDC056912]|uniref:hypothetical protein n=1 Tax=Paenarthrobacter sp. NPDC056912 TaxID=3345965 RepID=UPI00366CBE3E
MSKGLSKQQRGFLAALEAATSKYRPDYYHLAAELVGMPQQWELLEVGPPLDWGLRPEPENFAEWPDWWESVLRKHGTVSSSLRRAVNGLTLKGYVEIGWHRNSGLTLVRRTLSQEDRAEYVVLEEQARYYRSVIEAGGPEHELRAAWSFAAQYMDSTGIPPSDVNTTRYINRPKRSP